MPRGPRNVIGGLVYHVINRGNRQGTVFHGPADYDRFLDLMLRATELIPVALLGYSLMPNHFHLVMWPQGDLDLSLWMHWLETTYARHHNLKYGLSGHLWQGRFKAIPAQSDRHLFLLLRYVERNALAADLVTKAEDWPWSSAAQKPRKASFAKLIQEGPMQKPSDWIDHVNQPLTEKELEKVSTSVRNSLPLGSKRWITRVARLGQLG